MRQALSSYGSGIPVHTSFPFVIVVDFKSPRGCPKLKREYTTQQVLVPRIRYSCVRRHRCKNEERNKNPLAGLRTKTDVHSIAAGQVTEQVTPTGPKRVHSYCCTSRYRRRTCYLYAILGKYSSHSTHHSGRE